MTRFDDICCSMNAGPWPHEVITSPGTTLTRLFERLQISPGEDRPDSCTMSFGIESDKTAPATRFCYMCAEAFLANEEWRIHCREHIENSGNFCGRVTQNGMLLWPGLCPFCLGSETMLLENRLLQWTSLEPLLLHIETHLRGVHAWPLECPHPKCDMPCNDFDSFWEHMSINHGLSRICCPPNTPVAVATPSSRPQDLAMRLTRDHRGQPSMESFFGHGKQLHIMKRCIYALKKQLSNDCGDAQSMSHPGGAVRRKPFSGSHVRRKDSSYRNLARGRSEAWRKGQDIECSFAKRSRSVATGDDGLPQAKRNRPVQQGGK